MTYSYFPGCTLKTKAKDLDHYARISAEALGFTLEELPDWQCCGGVYPMAKNEIATKLSSIRALAKAKELGQPLVTLCSACHNVIKQVNHDMQTDDNIVLKANNYLKLAEPYQGETEVLHYLEVLRDKVGFDELKKKVVNPLKGKKIAMTWAYSPSYGKPLSVPQGIIGLMTRFGMDVVLAHPEGYDVMPEVEEIAKKNAEKNGGSFTKTNDMAEAFKDADIVYPKSWAPFAAMEKRTDLYAEGDFDGIDKLEKELLAQNAQHKDWACTEELMKTTKDGKALYLHCLPADITGVSCETGEVDASVFDRYRIPLYKEASFKPYIIAAMIFLSKFENPQEILKKLEERAGKRIFE